MNTPNSTLRNQAVAEALTYMLQVGLMVAAMEGQGCDMSRDDCLDTYPAQWQKAEQISSSHIGLLTDEIMAIFAQWMMGGGDPALDASSCGNETATIDSGSGYRMSTIDMPREIVNNIAAFAARMYADGAGLDHNKPIHCQMAVDWVLRKNEEAFEDLLRKVGIAIFVNFLWKDKNMIPVAAYFAERKDANGLN